MIIIAHTEPRPDELENRIQKGPFNKIKFLNQYCAKKKTRENPKSDWNQFEIESVLNKKGYPLLT